MHSLLSTSLRSARPHSDTGTINRHHPGKPGTGDTSDLVARRSLGVTLIEMVLVVAILAVLLAGGLLIVISARARAQGTMAENYASIVYKAAFAHVAEGQLLVEANDCETGYIAGGYSVPGTGIILACQVVDDGAGHPIVTVTKITGDLFSLP